MAHTLVRIHIDSRIDTMSNQYRISKDDILQATNGGLDIIRFYITDIDQYIRSSKKFRIRDTDQDKTPSASIKKMPDGNYVITDFGTGEKFNAITLTILFERCDFGSAIKLLADRYGIASTERVASMYQPRFSHEAAKPDQPDGETYYKPLQEVPESHLRILFSQKVFDHIEYKHRSKPESERREAVLGELRQLLIEQHWHGLESYTIIKARKATTIHCAEYYPIFRIEEASRVDGKEVLFSKIYQPKAREKKNRFFYRGTVDSQFLHGLLQVQKAYSQLQEERPDPEDEDEASREAKLEEIIFCTGGSDALNLRALGYHVVYPCSEYFKMKPSVLRKLMDMADSVMTCPDLDTTGQRENHKLCMDPADERYLDIRVIALPPELQQHTDQYGRPCKDVRDYFNHYAAKDFRNLVKVAKPYRFWDMHVSVDKDGNKKIKFGRPLYEYKFSPERILNFLQKNGFARYRVTEDTTEYVHVRDNVVRVVKAEDIKAYLVQFLRDRYFPEALIDSMHRSPMLNDSAFALLPEQELDFTDYDPDAQYLFFRNATWQVTKEGVKAMHPKDVTRKVWETKIQDHHVKVLDPMFRVTRDEAGEYDIEILDDSCMFFRFLIQTSRVHWRKELEENLATMPPEDQDAYRKSNLFNIAGPNLQPAEQHEQKMHLINKMFAVGYLLHRYKDDSKPWAVFAMDNKNNEDGLSHGGTGKSLVGKAVAYLKNTVNFDGKNEKLFDDNHAFEQVTKKTDLMSFNDADKRFRFDRLFAIITDELIVNPKGKQRVSLTYQESPKIYINTNYTPNEISPSVLRRLLFMGFSDYYHVDNNGEYNETRQPKDEFGKNLFTQFSRDEWNLAINFMAQCCAMYMNFPKIEAPMESLMARNLSSAMGIGFLMWAEVYFNADTGRRDCYVPIHVAMEEYIRESGIKNITAQGFNAKMRLFASLKKLNRDPKELCQKDGRIIKQFDIVEYDNRSKKWIKPGGKKSMVMVYLHTPGREFTDHIYDPTVEEQAIDVSDLKAPDDGKDELPF